MVDAGSTVSEIGSGAGGTSRDGTVPIGRPRSANFDALRLAGATSVILSHSFIITEGNDKNEPLARLLGGSDNFGTYGVFMFFVISGYLITESWYRSSPTGYLLKRCARIFPGLVACTLVVSAVGYIVAGLVRGEPRAMHQAIRYFAKTVLLYDTSRSYIGGLTFSDLPTGGILNGSLWTIGPEFLCYLAVAIVGLSGILGRSFVLVAFVASLAYKEARDPAWLGYVMCYFWAGSLLYHWKSRPPLGPASAAVAVAGFWIASAAVGPHASFAVFGAYLVVAIGTSDRIRLSGTTRFGDLTYGLYLYGWPVSQVVRFGLGDGAASIQVFLITLLVAAILAFLSWHVVEKPALRLAHRRAATGLPSPTPSAVVPPVGSRGD